jgi:hypothetical protein
VGCKSRRCDLDLQVEKNEAVILAVLQ